VGISSKEQAEPLTMQQIFPRHAPAMPNLPCFSLEVVLVIPCNDDIVYFQHHSTQLRGQQQLLAFTNQRVNDKMLSHICLKLVIAAALE
jgi:hypothetical protein